MAIEFRCEKCGKLLTVEASPSSMVECPYCKARVVVPAGLASLPRPQVPGGAVPPPLPPAAGPETEEEFAPEGEDALMGVMAKLMPWVISLFLHVGIGVVLAFITIVVIRSEAVADHMVASDVLSDDPGGRLNPGDLNQQMQAKSLKQINQQQWAKRDSTIPMASLGETKSRVQVFGFAGGSAGGASADFGLTTGGSGAGPRSRFFGTGGNAYHIVYVVDRSGSMLDTFDEVRDEMIRSVCRLSPAQCFHVIFFASGTPKENPPRGLVYATVARKGEAVKYLKAIQPQGQTDPIPALQRAFQVLGNTRNRKRGKLVYLLTDAEFVDSEKVLEAIRKMNAGKQVHINTILHHHRSPAAMKTLRRIADENGGRFKFVEPNT
jgi:DNA-directed RNA polymerase subunit RPC12/RpoP